MHRPIIEVENLSKRYRLGQFSARTLREEAEQLFSRFRKKIDARGVNLPVENSIFWALKDVSFCVLPGEVVGIIGRNGAGKSTLLKILSRVTEPTSGLARMRGRVASLLEIGTGFHPELTGRENIFLNGTILGMRKTEIKAKFDSIVDFADIGSFLDTPVKRYSSGMYVRLAFAVAAHLEQEVLIVDEVLAVGDADFQKKCLGKINEVSSQAGRTVLLVSHNLASINALCKRAILLENGKLIKDCTIDQVIMEYIWRNSPSEANQIAIKNVPRAGGHQNAIQDAWIENTAGRITNAIPMGEPFSVCFEFRSDYVLKKPGYGFGIEDLFGRRICSFSTSVIQTKPLPNARGGTVKCLVSENRLLPGRHLVSVAISEGAESVDYIERAL